MAANKSNPNMTQAQFLALSSRVNAVTGYQAESLLYNKRKPKETAALIAARKVVKDYETKCQETLKAVKSELAKAKTTAMDAVLFQSQEAACAAVHVLESKYDV